MIKWSWYKFTQVLLLFLFFTMMAGIIWSCAGMIILDQQHQDSKIWVYLTPFCVFLSFDGLLGASISALNMWPFM